MISGINIDSFRGIKNFKLENLSQINILTGDNNSGKTSILEVLASYGQPDDFRMWQLLVRQETEGLRRIGFSHYESFYDLFDINLPNKILSYTVQEDEKRTTVSMCADIIECEVTEREYMDMLMMSYARKESEYEMSDNMHQVSRMDMEIVINGEKVSDYQIYDEQIALRFTVQSKNEFTNNIIYLPSASHIGQNVYLQQIFDQPELYEEILDILKEYDKDIISINYSNGDNAASGKGVYKILSKAHRKALPLNVYGDGMKKAILMISAVVKAQNGVLLVDEFETAIHTSAMDKTFKWILDTCKKLNVQIFMTSHNKEAIDKVLKCAPELIDDIAVYTIYKEDEDISVRRLDGKKAVEVQDEMGLELR